MRMVVSRKLGTGIALATAMGLLPAQVSAQDLRWLQIEAHRDIDTALGRLEDYQQSIGSGVQVFQLPSGWYALSLGPFESDGDAFAARSQLRATLAIPSDSYVSSGANYQAALAGDGMTAPDPAPMPSPGANDDAPALAALPEPAPEPEPEPEETLREAQASERSLTRDDRAALQIALQWFGHYTQGIDAAFGPGTRNAMAAWQAAQGLEATGVLTTRQRGDLLADYSGELAALGMELHREDRAGIEIELPMALLAVDRAEAPFVHFSDRDGSGVRALLISQTGTQATLFGLYEIMQTLDIVPLEGTRERRQNAFVLTGQNDEIRSHTVAQLRDGQIKGYTLIWPPERDEQIARVLPMMEASFATFGDALPDTAGQASAVSRRDLLAGLSVRRPDFSRSGFYIDAAGTVLTGYDAVASCGRITIDEAYNAQVVARDPALGLAILRPETPLVPMAFAQFANSLERIGTEITISGYPFEDLLTRPVLTFGTIEDAQGLEGETDWLRLGAEIRSGDIGGPVFGRSGAVIGMLTQMPENPTRQLPENVNFAVPSTAIQAFLGANGVSSGMLRDDVTLAPEQLTRVAGDLTVLVSCWN